MAKAQFTSEDIDRRMRVTAWVSYAKSLQPLLGVEGWAITPSDNPPDDPDAVASIYSSQYNNAVELRMTDEFFDLDSELQRFTIVHELCHLVFIRYTMFANELAAQLGAQAAFFAQAQLNRYLEQGINTMALTIARSVPMPAVFEQVEEEYNALLEAYGRYDSDSRVGGPDDFEAFRDALSPFIIPVRSGGTQGEVSQPLGQHAGDISRGGSDHDIARAEDDGWTGVRDDVDPSPGWVPPNPARGR